MKKNRTLALTLFLLISCGGGGGGGSNDTPVISQTPTPPTTPPSLSYDELKDQYEGYYEYQSQWGLNMVNASSAYARGATGAGITIGITDSGLDNSHVEISATRLSSNSRSKLFKLHTKYKTNKTRNYGSFGCGWQTRQNGYNTHAWCSF